jgi:hypothetical protein
VRLEALGYTIQTFLFYRRGQYMLTECLVGFSQTEKRNVRTAFGKQFDERSLLGRQATVVMTFKDSSIWSQQKTLNLLWKNPGSRRAKTGQTPTSHVKIGSLSHIRIFTL